MLTRTVGVVLVLTLTSTTAGDGIEITGTVRDFSAGHRDFGVVPTGGRGHYAGNVGPLLPSDRRPLFANGAGFKVLAQWQDVGLE